MNRPDAETQATYRHIDQAVAEDGHRFCLGKLALMSKFVTTAQVETALQIRAGLVAKNGKRCLGNIMLGKQMISHAQFNFLNASRTSFETRRLDVKFGQLAIDLGFANKIEVDEALKQQKQLFKQKKSIKLLGDIMVSKGTLTAKQLNEILSKQRRINAIKQVVVSKYNPTTGSLPTVLNPADSNQKETISFNLQVSEDNMQAYIFIDGEIPEFISTEQVLGFLLDKKIESDLIDTNRLGGMLKDLDGWKKPQLIASGRKSIAGRDAEIKYHFATDPYINTMPTCNINVHLTHWGIESDLNEGLNLASNEYRLLAGKKAIIQQSNTIK